MSLAAHEKLGRGTASTVTERRQAGTNDCSFISVQEGGLAALWRVGVSYQLKLYLFGLIPLGNHTIRLVRIDEVARTIVSQESGRLARVWNHTISFRADGETALAGSQPVFAMRAPAPSPRSLK